MVGFPSTRMRRLRRTSKLRDLVAEVTLTTSHMVYPMFVKEGITQPEAITSMPAQFRYPLPDLVREAQEAVKLGIPAVILFGIPTRKDSMGSSAYDEDGVVQRAVRELRKQFGDGLIIITDVCLCHYTDSGHCGVVEDACISNDATLGLLAKTAVSHARAGADIVAPSAMMDGSVRAVRGALDEGGFADTAIMSYAAKFASSLYQPYRSAAYSAPLFGDRRSYQMDYRNSLEALREVALDVEEGADIVMVKPALLSLDIIHRVKSKFKLPVAAFSVSGEYAMVKAASEKGWLDERAVVIEYLLALKRAGADIILTYHAKDVARWIR